MLKHTFPLPPAIEAKAESIKIQLQLNRIRIVISSDDNAFEFNMNICNVASSVWKAKPKTVCGISLRSDTLQRNQRYLYAVSIIRPLVSLCIKLICRIAL